MAAGVGQRWPGENCREYKQLYGLETHVTPLGRGAGRTILVDRQRLRRNRDNLHRMGGIVMAHYRFLVSEPCDADPFIAPIAAVTQFRDRRTFGMQWLVLAAIIVAVTYGQHVQRRGRRVVIPTHFVVFDLESTGLDPDQHEIIELGAIRVNRESDVHDSIQAFVKPVNNGDSIEKTLEDFLAFVGDLPLVSFNAELEMAFLKNALRRVRPDKQLANPVSCALTMARRAWPGRKSYRLIDLARGGRLSADDTHRALGDCKRALIVYNSAASRLRKAA